MNDQQNSDTPESQQPRPGGFLTLPVILVIGWLIYEGTHEPAIAAMAMCLKFGLEDFRTARWLLRTDPDGGRGRSCAWLYIASGLWQTAVIGLAMVLLTVVLDELIQGRPQKPKDAVGLRKLLNGATLTILFGFTFSTLATYVAMLYAWRHRVRPWLNGSVHYARKNNEWPPLYGQSNRILIPTISTLVITCFFLLPACFFIVAMILTGVLPAKILFVLASLGSIMSVIILLPALVVILYNLRKRHFFAEHPADCWGEEPLPKPSWILVDEREDMESA